MNLARLCSAMLGTTSTVMYTATDVDTRIQRMSLLNTSGADVTASVWITQGGGAGDGNIVLKAETIPAGKYLIVRSAEGQTIENGDSIYASASVASVVNMVASGIEITAT